MTVIISDKLKKESIVLGKNGVILSHNKDETKADEMKRKQDERAKRLGFK